MVPQIRTEGKGNRGHRRPKSREAASAVRPPVVAFLAGPASFSRYCGPVLRQPRGVGRTVLMARIALLSGRARGEKDDVWGDQGIGRAAEVGAEARPPVVTRTAHRARSHRVHADVASNASRYRSVRDRTGSGLPRASQYDDPADHSVAAASSSA
jgi:hypothetical protein